MNAMKNHCMLFAMLLCIIASPARAQLPPEIRYDLTRNQAQQYMKNKQYAEAAEKMKSMRELAEANDLKEDWKNEGRAFLFDYAQVSAYNDDPVKSVALLHEFLTKEGKASPHYAEALQLLADQEGLAIAEAQSQLFLAAKQGDLAKIKQSIATGTDVNAKNNRNNTPLLVATGKGHAMVAEALIAAGADVNAKNNRNDTPLLVATGKGHAAVVEVLIAAGADVNAKNNRNNTPLLVAIAKENASVIEALIAAGADVNAKNSNNDTPLLVAIATGNAAVEALIAAGADVNAKSRNGDTPLHFAAKTAKAEAVNTLIAADADVNAKNNSGNTPMHAAVQDANKPGDRYAIITALKTAGANDKIKNNAGLRVGKHCKKQHGRRACFSLIFNK